MSNDNVIDLHELQFLKDKFNATGIKAVSMNPNIYHVFTYDSAEEVLRNINAMGGYHLMEVKCEFDKEEPFATLWTLIIYKVPL